MSGHIPNEEKSPWVQPGNWANKFGGLTKREMFAAMVMESLYANNGLPVPSAADREGDPGEISRTRRAEEAARAADALLSALRVMSLVSSDPNASKNERMADKAHDAVIVLNYIADPTYAPYCMRCSGLHRMKLVEPFLWEHDCGAIHDERQVLCD